MGPDRLCMRYRGYRDLGYTVRLQLEVPFHWISLCWIPCLGFKFVFVCVCTCRCLLQQWQKVPIDSVTSRNPFDMRWMDSFGRLPHSRLYKTSPKHFLSAMYSIYNYTVFVCVLIIVCDSWQAYKRYTINLPIECFSVPVSEILYPVFPTYRGDNGKCMSLLLLSLVFFC